MIIRAMQIEDYDKVAGLWSRIHGFGIRSIDDSREGIERFLKRNPTTSVVAEEDDAVIGAILCGHDGRTGYFYHVCVDADNRNRGIGKRLAAFAAEALKKEHINKISLLAFKRNEVGNAVWKELGWTCRDDLNLYDLILNDENCTVFNQD